jgi:rfaE bifunctional protein kinase chain/domain
MHPVRFQTITGNYSSLRIALAGDFCLDRYYEIDGSREEISLETGLPVHNVERIRSQPGGAGTILNNLSALGIGTLYPVGFCGEDGEGYELQRALAKLPGVRNEFFFSTPLRHTFTYGKPLWIEAGLPPRELNRLDLKNWEPTPAPIEEQICGALRSLAGRIDALILLEQVDRAETGVLTRKVLQTVQELISAGPAFLCLADSRRGLQDFPEVVYKMNARELGKLLNQPPPQSVEGAGALARQLALRTGKIVVVTLAEQGMLGTGPEGKTVHVPALPLRGPIDIVGAGDSVTANLTAALAAGAQLQEALELATAAASVVIHQVGTTGTATVPDLKPLLLP